MFLISDTYNLLLVNWQTDYLETGLMTHLVLYQPHVPVWQTHPMALQFSSCSSCRPCVTQKTTLVIPAPSWFVLGFLPFRLPNSSLGSTFVHKEPGLLAWVSLSSSTVLYLVHIASREHLRPSWLQRSLLLCIKLSLEEKVSKGVPIRMILDIFDFLWLCLLLIPCWFFVNPSLRLSWLFLGSGKSCD